MKSTIKETAIVGFTTGAAVAALFTSPQDPLVLVGCAVQVALLAAVFVFRLKGKV